MKSIVGNEKLQMAIQETHQEVHSQSTNSLKRQIDLHNRRTNISRGIFITGDRVLVRREHEEGPMLNFVWRSPKRISRVLSI